MRKVLALFLALAMSAAGALTTSAADVTGRTVDITIEKASAAPVIDGTFSEAEWGTPISSINKENRAEFLSLCANDASLLENDELLPTAMDTYLRWDENGFYFCSVMEIRSHYNAATRGNEGSLWKGTSFIIQTISDASITDSITKTIIGMNNNGEILFNTETVEANTAAVTGTTVPVYDEIAIVRENNTTIYEMSFLWDTVLPEGTEMAAGDDFIFYALFMPAMDSTANPVDVVPAGINEQGRYLYWNVTLGESSAAPSLIPTPDSGYTSDDSFLYNIFPETTIDMFTEQFDTTSGTITVTAPDGTVLMDPDAYIGTGYTVSLLVDGTAVDTRIAIVTGDVTGDGLSEDADVTVLQRYFAGWSNYADSVSYPAAADLNGDGKLTRADGMLLARRNAGWNV